VGAASGPVHTLFECLIVSCTLHNVQDPHPPTGAIATCATCARAMRYPIFKRRRPSWKARCGIWGLRSMNALEMAAQTEVYPRLRRALSGWNWIPLLWGQLIIAGKLCPGSLISASRASSS